MIIKRLDPFASNDKYEKAGRAAEENMEFYLRRFFENDPNIYVLNSIRIENNDDAAQIDHLIVHPFGMIIIECKSVHGKLQLKDDGQWVRWYGNSSKGMKSPVIQARMQADFLRIYLNSRSTNNHHIFDDVPIDILVAISDEGIFLPPKSNPNAAPEVCKADQINERVRTIQSKLSNILFSKENIAKICDFLLIKHAPLVKTTAPIQAVKIPEPLKVDEPPIKSEAGLGNVCKYCGSKDLEINFGRSYYFRCLKCDKNTPIKILCPICNRSEKIRKEGRNFFSECSHCKTSKLFHTNL